jgi:hypothetical protein
MEHPFKKFRSSATMPGSTPSERGELGSIQPNPEASGSVESNLVQAYPLTDSEVALLIQFFETLDRWGRELHVSIAGEF